MLKDNSSNDDGINAAVSLLSHDQRHPPPPQMQSEGIGFSPLYSSIFPTPTSLSNSLSFTPSGCSCDEDSKNNNAVATENRLYLARLTLEYQELVDRYRLCLTHLHETAKEAEALRQENAELFMVNKDLTERMSLLTQASFQNRLMSSGFPSLSIINDFSRLCVGDNVRDSHISGEVQDASPTSVLGSNRFDTRNVERVSLPKSISIRSSGYLNTNQAGGSNGGSSRTNPLRVASPVINGTQRVCVPETARKREEEALELEVYNQGMFKTELCNKWQETGKCPYKDACQFAHGIAELRPVIRHPRYKTEVCRVILAGHMCPYGHRCHFRHALTDQERCMGPALSNG